MRRRALITGIAGQDGSYLAELLLMHGYDVHGTVRPEAAKAPSLLAGYMTPILGRVELHPSDLARPETLRDVFEAVMPDECYHLGGPSTVDSNVSGSANVFSAILESTRILLECLRRHRTARLFFAGTSEIFGSAMASPQNEQSPPRPRSIYGLAKLAAWDLIVQQRNRHALFACVGILYNHESIRRPTTFLPRKVSSSLARVAAGLQDHIVLGNLTAQRDWGYAPDYVEAMKVILDAAEPSDYIVATGALHSVADLVEIACRELSLKSRDCVRTDPQLFRPAEVVTLRGDATRLNAVTGWRPRKCFSDMISEMARHDYEQILRQPTSRRVHVNDR